MPVICAWCGKTIREGDPDAPPSHGICADCERRQYAEFLEWLCGEGPWGGGRDAPPGDGA